MDIKKKNENPLSQNIINLLTFSIKSFFQIFSIRKQKYDMIVAWSGVPAGFIAMLFRLFLGVPYVVLLCGSDVPFHEEKWKTLDKWIFSWLSPIIWKNAHAVIANSDKLKETALRSNPKQEIEVIYNGIDTHRFFPAEKYEPTLPLKIITVGRLSEIKGQRYLIEALKGIKAELYIIGDGDLREELMQLTKDLGVTVHFLGFIPNDEIPNHLRQSHIFALPSLNEGMSNSLMEAMACGLPILVTDVGGTKELLHENGILVEKKSAKSIQDAIIQYIESSELMIKHGENSRKITEKMSWETKTAEYYDSFQKAIAK